MNKANLTIYLQTSWDWRQFGLALWRGRAGGRGAHESGDTGKEATIGLLSDGVSSAKVRLQVNLSAWALQPQ